MSFSPGAIEGLTFVSAAGAAQFTGAALARGGRDAELQSKGKHGGNSLRLEAGHCYQLSNPHVMTAYHKWAANQGTAKKAPFWGFWMRFWMRRRPLSGVFGCVLGGCASGYVKG